MDRQLREQRIRKIIYDLLKEKGWLSKEAIQLHFKTVTAPLDVTEFEVGYALGYQVQAGSVLRNADGLFGVYTI